MIVRVVAVLSVVALVSATSEIDRWAKQVDEIYEKLQTVGLGDGHMGIVNGTETNYTIWRGTVAVRIIQGPGQNNMCTGSFIDPEVILTAAHCCIANIGPDSGYEIWGGADVNHPVYDSGFQIAGVVAQDLLSTGFPANDICTLKLDRSITAHPYYDIRIGSAPPLGTPTTMVGYGVTASDGSSRAGVHRTGASTVVSSGNVITIRGGPQGVCSGDSGGPLMIFDSTRQKYTIAGVASTASFPCSGDGTGNYPATHSAASWINDRVLDYTGHPLRNDGHGQP